MNLRGVKVWRGKGHIYTIQQTIASAIKDRNNGDKQRFER